MNSKIESIILCVVMVASISIPITQNVGESSSTLGGTIYVDDDNTSGIEDGSLQYPYNTIQEGVDAASSGDTVYVFNGMYYEHVIISKSYLILQGENRDTTRIDGGGSGHIINVDADYVDISGFTIKNGGRGIYVSNSIGITICDNYMSSSVSNNRGIYLTQTGQCDVYENTIQDNNGKGIFLDINCIYNDIFKNNLINNKDEGIRLASHSNNNNIFENIIQSSYGFGIYITQSSDDNTIRNNIIRDHPHSAIKVANTYPYGNNNRIYHNNFINNIASDGGTNIWDDGYPSGGNYWSDYGGNDFYHGSKQDIPGSDGIGDTPYPIPDGSNQDRYPFMNPISIFNKPPIPDAGSDQSIGEGDSVQFDGSASYDPDGTIVSYEWDFGDGSPIGTGVNPTHIYNTPGNYTVTLTVTDDDNATDSDTCIITVLAVIQPPNADAGPDQTVNEGDVVQFKGCNSTGSTDGDPPSVNPSVVALWHMNEGSGSIIYDETSNNNDGIISDASWTTGKFGSALRFEDTDIVYEIPASFDDSITTDITMVAWVYWEGPHPWTYSKNSYIFDARDFEGTRGGFILYLDPSGTLVFILLYGYNTGDYQIIRSTCKIPIKRWTHISGVLDYTNGDLKIYINGNEDTSVPATEPYYGFGGSHWDAAIGNNRYAPGDNQWAPFNGIIDEAVIYNRALTAQELPSTPAEIISYKWDFDDSDGIDWDNPDATGPTPTHIHGDNGVYIVTLKITDKTGATATDTCNITVLNVAPTVDLNGPYLGGEGSPITFTSMATDPGSDDLTFTWNWGDGTTATTSTYYNNGIGPEPIYDPSTNEIKSPEGTFPFDVTDTLSHTYGDNGVYTITLTVTDDDRGTTIITTNVVVNNVAPTITLAITPSGDEGSSLTFEAGATDPGSDDLSFSWEFEYGPTIENTFYNNGVSPEPIYDPVINEIKSPQGTYPFNASDIVTHTYGDDYNYTLVLTVYDDDGGSSVYTTTITIDNVAPSIIEFMIPYVAYEGTSANYRATVKDLGSDDLTFEWDFGDSTPVIENTFYNNGTTPDPYPSPNGIFPFIAQDTLDHIYGDNYNYTLTFKVTDDDGGITTLTTTVYVNNVAPTIEPFGPFTVDEGMPLDITAISNDLGSDDLTFIWEFEYGPTITNVHYNDGVSPDPYPSPEGNYPFNVTDTVTHAYGDNGVFTVTLTVIDDDNGKTSYTTNITVNNVAPTINPIWPMILIFEGTPFTLSANSTDQGSDDLTFTWEFELGPTITNIYYNDDANPDPYPSPWGTHPFSAVDQVSLTYGDNGVYAVTVTVEDDDKGIAYFTANITVYNVAPTIEPFGPFTVDEGKPVDITAISTDPGSDDLTFTWEFDYGPTYVSSYYNDGTGPDPYPSPWGTYPFSISDDVTHTYGDNGVFLVILTVEDDDGGSTTFITNITVKNVAPVIEKIEAYMYANISLRVAGEKYHSVDIYLYEEGSQIWMGKVTRYPGSPDEQKATIANVKLDMTKRYSAKVDYLPNDPRVNGNVWGGNPVWIEIEFENESTARIHHTFNVRQSYWNSDHWNHIDPWEVELNPHLLGHNITLEGIATDPGSDDLTFTWDFGDGATAGPTTYYNNGLSPDPYPSPEINPMNVTDTCVHSYTTSGTYTITLVVEDDDGAITVTTLEIGL